MNTDRQFLFYSRPWIITPPWRKRGVKRIRDGVGRALLGLGGTLGFRSVSLALMAATWAGYHFISLHLLHCSTFSFFFQSAPFSSFPPSPNVLPLAFSYFLSPFLFLSALFIYSFGPAAALCPLARRPVGCPLVVGRCSFEYFCSRNTNVRRRLAQASIQWPTMVSRREKERRSTYLAGRYTPHFGGPANFGYSPCQHGRYFLESWRYWFLTICADPYVLSFKFFFNLASYSK